VLSSDIDFDALTWRDLLIWQHPDAFRNGLSWIRVVTLVPSVKRIFTGTPLFAESRVVSPQDCRGLLRST
jgi:hypothetical protein